MSQGRCQPTRRPPRRQKMPCETTEKAGRTGLCPVRPPGACGPNDGRGPSHRRHGRYGGRALRGDSTLSQRQATIAGATGSQTRRPFLLPQRCRLGGHEVGHSQVPNNLHLPRPSSPNPGEAGSEDRDAHGSPGRIAPPQSRGKATSRTRAPLRNKYLEYGLNPPGLARNIPPVLVELRPGTERTREERGSRPVLKGAFFFTLPASRSQLIFAFQWENPENGTQANWLGRNLCLGDPLPRKQSSVH